jgi:predicted TIM-barrel fold metal-dependent hydrolase
LPQARNKIALLWQTVLGGHMSEVGRRRWLQNLASVFVAGRFAPSRGVAATAAPEPAEKPLQLKDYEPRSMLHVAENKVPRARYPLIDVHTHLSHKAKQVQGVGVGEQMRYSTTAEGALPLMDRKNIRMMVNLTGGVGKGLEEVVQKFPKAYPDRFSTFTEPWYERIHEPGYARFQADQIARAHEIGARGLKILKLLGLFLRERVSEGPLVKVDDLRFDPMWETCGSLNMPVAIHVSDPEAFFLPIDRFNERFEELNEHPDWSFYDRDFPSNAEILEARNRVIARHPKTQFIALHVGNNAENLGYVSECMDRFPNMHVEIAARIGELGRQPRNARKFFDRYQDRIMFGTDASPNGKETPQQVFNDQMYEIYFRFLETEDEYFDYAPSRVPPQGRWRIYGLGLPDEILKKVYYENAARLLQINI